MAIAKQGTDTSGSDAGIIPGAQTAISHTLVSSATPRKVIVYIQCENGDTTGISGVTYGGVAMTEAANAVTGTTGFRNYCAMWFIDEANLPSNGANDCVITWTGTEGTSEMWAAVAQYNDIAQGASTNSDTTAESSPGDAVIENTLSAIASTEWAFSVVGAGNTGSFAHGQGQVETFDFTDASSQTAVAELRGGASETSLDSTFTGTLNRLVRIAAVWDEFTGVLISSVTPDDPLRMDQSSVTIVGVGFEASQGAAEVTVSNNATTGSGTVVDVTAAVTSWSDTSISLNLSNLSQSVLDSLHSLGPGDGNRYVHVENDSSEQSGGFAVHLMRPIAIALSLSGNITASGENTTFQLAAPSGKTTGDFGGGRIQDDENPTDAVNLNADEYREDEWCLEGTAQALLGQPYQFRVLAGGAELDTYTVDPRWTFMSVAFNAALVGCNT